MTHDEATARLLVLNRDETGAQHWFAKEITPGDWELVSVAVPGAGPRGPLKNTVEARPEPQMPPDPRPAIVRNVPPYGGV